MGLMELTGCMGIMGLMGLMGRTDCKDVGINVGINDLWPANQFAGLESS